jgi:hypothetical protein
MLLSTALFGEDPQISLVETESNYTIENDYYKAIIPKANAYGARGIVKWLYVKKSNGQWSYNLVYEYSYSYGLGYLEGTGTADKNRPFGLQNSYNLTVTVLENTSAKIHIRARDSNYLGTDYTEDWKFWAGKPYFQSEANAVVVDDNGFLTNQFQFAWMINNCLTTECYGTDENGNIIQFNNQEIQQIHSPNLNTYPWINWKFVYENVSLGLIFTDIYDHYGTVAETGLWNYEYQMDFELGSGALGSPVKRGYKRKVTTIYYTSNQATNDDISNFAQNHYQNAFISVEQNPVLQAAQYINNPYGQNEGLGSALVSSPFFLVRQNTQNMHYGTKRPQYETSIYGPLYKYQKTINEGGYDFIDQVIYSLNYSNDSQSFEYGIINDVNASNSDYETSLQMRATSSDGKLQYNSVFKTWSDSDKLKIEGSASNASSSALVKDIYISLVKAPQTISEAENGSPLCCITSTLNDSDNLWTKYNYNYDSGKTLIYWDKRETVPALSLVFSIPDGEYKTTAYVAERPEGAVIYRYSTDGLTWNSFIVAQAGANGIKAVDLGVLYISNSTFYIDDDNDASSGINGWAGWDCVTFKHAPVNLGSNVYDIRFYGDLYGEIGIAVKVNTPVNSGILVDDSEVRVYLYKEDTAQTLTDFNYPFDIEIYPHKSWLADACKFTSLHSQQDVNYIKHTFRESYEGPPAAFPTAMPSFGEVPLTVQFAANASDPNNDPLTYAWNFGDQLSGDNNGTLENPTHTYNQNGLYHVALDVNDGLETTHRSISIRVGRDGIDYLLGDVDFDGDVDFGDFSVFANAYRSENGDLNYNSDADFAPDNCVIDLYDFTLLADDWLMTLDVE